MAYISFGEPLPGVNPDLLRHDLSKKTLAACILNPDFELIELRMKEFDGKRTDIIVVDCTNDQVPSRNTVGIKTRERLALVFPESGPPELRVLRDDFPPVLHRNLVQPGEPISLCLYFEPWSAVERTWTAQKHLQRILWWLKKTAKGELHRPDQPLERFYFDSPIQLVLPPDFEEKIKDSGLSLTFCRIERSDRTFKILRAIFMPKGDKKHPIPKVEVLSLDLPAIVHASTEDYCNTLGSLNDQFAFRGIELLPALNRIIRDQVPNSGIERNPENDCLLTLTIPLMRVAGTDPETYEVRAFLMKKDLAGLGESTGALSLLENRLYAVAQIGGSGTVMTNSGWQEIILVPVEVRKEPDHAFAQRASGVAPDTAQFKSILAGVGALGSSLAEIWAKEGWGEWSFVDPEILEPHNVVRHSADNIHVGEFKVDAVKAVVESRYYPGYYCAEAIPTKITNHDNPALKSALSNAKFLVDATTTLEVPRELSRQDTPRSVSVFLTPSGRSSVMLLESADRRIRLDSLEAQYYREIINSDWGGKHLEGNAGHLWVGAGCRDPSAVISAEEIQLHAATLAKQVRLLRNENESRIRVWCEDNETGAISVRDIPSYPSSCDLIGEWCVSIDDGTREKLRRIRNIHLPKETGGIICGYIDQKLKTIFVVDVLEAPSDSEEEASGFIRGIEGLKTALDEMARRTANIVGYVGEWHSHPAFVPPEPSSDDRILLREIARKLASEGQPALMLIVGTTGEISLSIRQS